METRTHANLAKKRKKKMAEKWFICVPAAPWVYPYDTKEEMLSDSDRVIKENYLDGDSGWSEEVHHAFAGYGEVKDKIISGADWGEYEEYLETLTTHVIKEEIIDRVENYPKAADGEEEAEEWPYGADFDYVASSDLTEKAAA